MPAPSKKVGGKPKFVLFSRRIATATLLISGACYYWFSYRPWAKHRLHYHLEEQAQEYWKLHQSELEEQKKS